MIICDLDGTAFSNIQRQYLIPDDKTKVSNWDAFNKACDIDLPITPVIDLVKFLSKQQSNENYGKVIFITARGESARMETLAQITKEFTDYTIELHMRGMDDNRCTTEYKRDVLFQLSDNFQHDSVLIDDHPGIMEMVKIHFPNLNRLLVPSFDCTLEL